MTQNNKMGVACVGVKPEGKKCRPRFVAVPLSPKLKKILHGPEAEAPPVAIATTVQVSSWPPHYMYYPPNLFPGHCGPLKGLTELVG